jgi:hypothetical protein
LNELDYEDPELDKYEFQRKEYQKHIDKIKEKKSKFVFYKIEALADTIQSKWKTIKKKIDMLSSKNDIYRKLFIEGFTKNSGIGREVDVNTFKDIVLTYCETNRISLDDVPAESIDKTRECVKAFADYRNY